MTSSGSNVPKSEAIKMAWEVYKQKDSLLANRTGSLFAAQAFLIVAYITVVVARLQWPGSFLFFLELSVALLGLLTTSLIVFKNQKLAVGLATLIDSFLKHDEVFSAYLNAANEKSHLARKTFSLYMPGVFLVFWFFLSVATVFRSGCLAEPS